MPMRREWEGIMPRSGPSFDVLRDADEDAVDGTPAAFLCTIPATAKLSPYDCPFCVCVCVLFVDARVV